MFKPLILPLVFILTIISNSLVAQNTLWDIIYCLNGGENKSVGISKLPAPNPTEKPGWNLIFSDEFQSDSLNPANWNRSNPWDDGNGTCIGSFAINPVNTVVENDHARVFNSTVALLPECPYSAGEIKTMSTSDTAFKSYYFYAPGYIETRVKLFNKTGQGAAFWLWAVGTPEIPGLPGPWNEIDIFELNGVNENIFTATYHWTYDGVHKSQIHNIYLTDSAQHYDLGANWTTFGLEWDTVSIKWFVNNSLVKELILSQVPPFCIAAAHFAKPLQPLCIRFNTGHNSVGNQSGVANPADLPQSMVIDYVRVYKKSGNKASPVILQDGLYQICATAISPQTSGKYIRTRYYPGAVYEWNSPAFEMEKVPVTNPQPREKMLIWIKPGIISGQAYPVSLKTMFPWNYTEYDTAYIYIAPGLPGLPPDNFTPSQLDTLCYFTVTTPATAPAGRCEYSLDQGQSWTAGTISHTGSADFYSFGKFKPEEHVEFAFREQNGCGYSPVRFSSLTMPPAPAGCRWPIGINDPGSIPESPGIITTSPNPVTGILHVRLPASVQSQTEKADLWIFDQNGRSVVHMELPGQDNQVNLSFLKDGMYHLQVRMNNTILYKKTFVKE